MRKLTPEEREQRRTQQEKQAPVETPKAVPAVEVEPEEAKPEEAKPEEAKTEEAPKKESKPKKTKDAADDVDTPAKQTKTVVSLSPEIPKSAE